MILSETKIRKLIRIILLEGGYDPGWGDFVPSPGDPDGPTVADLSKGAYDMHAVLATLSIADPTLMSDLMASLLYSAQGKPKEAAMVLAFAAGGVAAGAATVKLVHVYGAAKTSRAMKKLREADPDAAKRLQKEFDDEIKRIDRLPNDHSETEISKSEINKVLRKKAEQRVDHVKRARSIVERNIDTIVKRAEDIISFPNPGQLQIIGNPRQIEEAKSLIDEVAYALADSFDDLEMMSGWLEQSIRTANSRGGRMIDDVMFENESYGKAYRIAESYEHDWISMTKDLFPEGAPKEALNQTKTLFQKIKSFFGFGRGQQNVVEKIKDDLTENMNLNIITDNSMAGEAGRLDILGSGELVVNINTSNKVLRESLTTTTHHEVHHAFDVTASKFLREEIILLSPSLDAFERLLNFKVKRLKGSGTPLTKLSSLQRQFSEVGATLPAENHVRIMMLKRFIKSSGEQKTMRIESERSAIYRFFKRYKKHSQYTDPKYYGPRVDNKVVEELKKYPELDDFYDDWIEVFNNPQAQSKFLDELVNYGKAPSKVTPSTYGAFALTGAGKEGAQEATIDNQNSDEDN